MAVNSRLKATQLIGQRNAFRRQRISESSCARKETVYIGILKTPRNSDRKIMQSIRVTSGPPTRIRKWNQLSQCRWKSTKVIPVEKTQAGYISAISQGFKKGSKCWISCPTHTSLYCNFLVYPNSKQEHKCRNDKSIPFKPVWQIYRDKGQLQGKGT